MICATIILFMLTTSLKFLVYLCFFRDFVCTRYIVPSYFHDVNMCYVCVLCGQIPTVTTATPSLDRFIPNRKLLDFDACHEELSKQFINNENILNSNNGGSHTHTNTSVCAQSGKYNSVVSEFIAPTPKRLFAQSSADSSSINNNTNECVDTNNSNFLFASRRNKRPLGSSVCVDDCVFAGACSSSSSVKKPKSSNSRTLPNGPFRTLDAPDMVG
jgi:hypothetical protein